jgi:hypothetical protein
MGDENWSRATKKFYGFNSLAVLQNNWLDWVRQGSPAIDVPADSAPLVAVKLPGPSNESPRDEPAPSPVTATVALASSSAEKSDNATDDKPSVYELASAKMGSLEKTTPEPARSAAAEVGPVDEPASEAASEAAGQGSYQVTRPQAVQRPRQVILEWSRPPGSKPSGS